MVWDRLGASFLHYQLHAAQLAHATAIHLLPDAAGVRVDQRLAMGMRFIAHESYETFKGRLTQLEIRFIQNRTESAHETHSPGERSLRRSEAHEIDPGRQRGRQVEPGGLLPSFESLVQVMHHPTTDVEDLDLRLARGRCEPA